MTANDRRLIEDYLPIQAISAEASREKSVRKGHVSTLHLWWARRPLVASRAAVYGALVPASQFASLEAHETDDLKLARDKAKDFVTRLCKYAGNPATIAEARHHVLAAHAARLTEETGQTVTVDDIEDGRAPRPRVLDMFAGGGAIPLEALRLGCEVYALDLNPVAHIVEICTLVYPQQYGRPDPSAKGSAKGDTWAGLAEEVHYWGSWVLERVRAEIDDLYPPVPDPRAPTARQSLGSPQLEMPGPGFEATGKQKLATGIPNGYLRPVAYLWTRTVRCKNPACGATVPLVRQTWLCRKPGRYVALKMVAPPGAKRVRFEVVEATAEAGLGFDPAAFSKGGNAACPFCGAVADTEHVKAEGSARRMGEQMMAVACSRPGRQGKTYVSADDLTSGTPNEEGIRRRIDALCSRTGLTVPNEPLPPQGTLGFRVQAYGLKTWGDLFTSRQTFCLLSFAAAVREAEEEMQKRSLERARSTAVVTVLGAMVDRLASFASTQCTWLCIEGERTASTFGRHALPMVWDFSEVAPFNEDNAGWPMAIDRVVPALQSATATQTGNVMRGSAMNLPWADGELDAVITDPPYYDNVPYADLSDFFYVWLKRTIGHLYPEHFATETSPKKSEAVAEPMRFGGNREKAMRGYEDMMARAFSEGRRVLKDGGPMIVVYAHKTTLGWATLVDALRQAGFMVTEAWPMDTEKPGRLRAQESAALAASIFLVGRKRQTEDVGSYEEQVRPELELIIRERVETLWEMGISGADLVIAAVGAGLRAFTRYGRVEYANGDPVPAGRFLAEVEGVVLDTLLEKIFGVSGPGVSGVDGPSRFYVLWRFTYKTAELDAGEAIVFTYSQPVELEGPQGLSSGSRALVRKKQTKYRVLDFTERGRSDKLGLADRLGQPAPLIDVLHRILWLIEHEPRSLPRFLDEARPDSERLRLLAQALAGAGLKGKSEEDARALIATTGPEQAALAKLTANWRSVIEQQLPTAYGPLFAGTN